MIETINALTGLFSRPRYLEIGVSRGVTFHAVNADSKIAVDPAFDFDLYEARRRELNAEYHQVPSDDFFANYDGPSFDVAYIDGLHTLEQTLRDLLNVVSFTKKNSVIIIDDVVPNSFASAIADKAKMHAFREAVGDRDEAWMGNVFRLVYFVDTFLQQYSFASPIGGNPQLVLWRQARAFVPQRSLTMVGSLDYLDYILNKDVLRAAPLAEIVASAKRAGAGD